jgi:ribosomal protein S18 acetylase RimI-like enzyme
MTDADRLDRALCRAWERLCGVLDGARFERRDGYIWTICPPVRLPQFNSVWPIDDPAADQLETALAEMAELGLPYSLLTRRGRSPSFEREAQRLGLIPELDMPGMVAAADELVDVEVAGLKLVRVHTGDGLAQALAVASAGFGAPPELLAPLYDPALVEIDGFAIYLGRVDGVDVTTGMGFRIDDAVGVFTVATPDEHRGRGYGAAVTAQAVKDGFAAGATFAYLQSSEIGHSVYRRLGFRDVEHYTLHTAPEAPVVEPV